MIIGIGVLSPYRLVMLKTMAGAQVKWLNLSV